MMVTIRTASGRTIQADALIKSALYPSIFIYTNRLSEEEAAELFGNPEETAVLTRKTFDPSPAMESFSGYTELFAILPSMLWTENPGELFIWLNKKE